MDKFVNALTLCISDFAETSTSMADHISLIGTILLLLNMGCCSVTGNPLLSQDLHYNESSTFSCELEVPGKDILNLHREIIVEKNILVFLNISFPSGLALHQGLPDLPFHNR